MAPFNPFPVGYTPYGYQQFQPQIAPQIAPAQMPGTSQQQSKYVEVIPVDTVQEAEACPMAAGSSFLFFARDDSFIAVKSVGVNGQQSFSVFDKRPPAPVAPPFDPAAYVTKEELESRLAAVLTPKRATKKETEAE